jgi:uncharacterized protein (TIGR00369 family)
VSQTLPLTREQIQASMDRSPYIRFHQMQCESVDAETKTVVLRMPMRPELERAAGSGQWHGGAIAALIDTAGDYALALVVGGGVPTINFRTDFLRPANGDRLLATATIRRAGRTVGVVDVDVHDGEGRLVAVGRGCYSAKRADRSMPPIAGARGSSYAAQWPKCARWRQHDRKGR